MKRDTLKDMMKATHALVVENGHYKRAQEIIDYYSFDSVRFPVQEMTNYRFDFQAVPNFGSSEGIYLDCSVVGIVDGSNEQKHLNCGTYKTLITDLEAMQIMGELAGSLTYYNRMYVNKNIDRYTPDDEL